MIRPSSRRQEFSTQLHERVEVNEVEVGGELQGSGVGW